MSQPQVTNKQIPKTPVTSNQKFQPCRPMQSLTEERVKEVITETLITFNLIPPVHQKKVIANV